VGLANGRPPFEANVAAETKFIGFVIAADAAGVRSKPAVARTLEPSMVRFWHEADLLGGEGGTSYALMLAFMVASVCL
jgi:hypothetical protein